MLIDNQLFYSDKQVLSAAGANSKNTIDITKAGESIPTLKLRVSVDMESSSGTLGFDLETSDTDDFATKVTLASLTPAAVKFGPIFQGHLPHGLKRFSRVKFTGTATSGIVSAFLVGEVPIMPVN